MSVIRVAIVDDHPMFRMGLAAAIEEMDGIELVGEAQHADQVPSLVDVAAPHVVLLDVRLADSSGLEVNRWLAEHHPDVRVIMLTMSEDHDTALTALRDGGVLSPRETEIAQLVGHGLTNRQIAATAHISERTVETHVQHVLAKLGFTGRTQIAAWAARREPGVRQ